MLPVFVYRARARLVQALLFLLPEECHALLLVEALQVSPGLWLLIPLYLIEGVVPTFENLRCPAAVLLLYFGDGYILLCAHTCLSLLSIFAVRSCSSKRSNAFMHNSMRSSGSPSRSHTRLMARSINCLRV